MGDSPLLRGAFSRGQNHRSLHLLFIATLSCFVFGAVVVVCGWMRGPSRMPLSAVADWVNGDTNMEPLALSHLLFGIAGATSMWKERAEVIRLWWRKDEMRGYIFLDFSVDPSLKFDDLPEVRVSEPLDNFTRVEPVPFDRTVHIRVARVIIESYRTMLEEDARISARSRQQWPEPRWFIGADDDTVFSPENLLDVLARYDHREMLYIGGRSESMTNQALFGHNMAFGGGGYAISWGLMTQLMETYDACLERYAELLTADQRIATCAGEHGVQVTHEPGFHQMDLRGDISGLFMRHPQAPLVSLHHFAHLEPLFPNMTRLDAAKRLMQGWKEDPPGFMQQAICWDRERDATYTISSGFAIKVYGGVRRICDLTLRSEMTFGSHFLAERPNRPEHFTFDVRAPEPVMESVNGTLPCGTPYMLYTGGTTVLKNSSLDALYYRQDHPSYPCLAPGARIRAIRVQTEPSPLVTLRKELRPGHWTPWGRNLRKLCCQSIETLDNAGTSLLIRVGKCRPGQLVAEPSHAPPS